MKIITSKDDHFSLSFVRIGRKNVDFFTNSRYLNVGTFVELDFIIKNIASWPPPAANAHLSGLKRHSRRD